MINAKEELESLLKGKKKVKCAFLIKGYRQIYYILKVKYSKQEYIDFLNSLDFTYDNGYGVQQLYGIVWLEDGTWFTRGEYDGSEWWNYNSLPEIPENCL